MFVSLTITPCLSVECVWQWGEASTCSKKFSICSVLINGPPYLSFAKSILRFLLAVSQHTTVFRMVVFLVILEYFQNHLLLGSIEAIFDGSS